MNIDYSKLITDSARFSWNNKKFWILAFISFFASTMFSYITPPFDSSKSTGIGGVSEAVGIALLIGLVVVMLVYLVVALYLSSRATISIYLGSKDDLEMNEVSARKSWYEAARQTPRLIGFQVLAVIFLILIYAVLFVPIVAIAVISQQPAILILLCCVLILLIPLAIAISATVNSIMYFLIIGDNKIMDAVTNGFNLFRKYWEKFLILMLIQLGISIAYMTVAIIIFFLINLLYVAMLGVVTAAGVNYWVSVVISIVGGVIVSAVYSALLSPYLVFTYNVSVRFIRKLLA